MSGVVDSLFFTLPLLLSTGPRSCAVSNVVALSPQHYRVFARVQSDAWVAMRPAMLMDPAVFAATWPTVAAECARFVVVEGNGVPGQRVGVAIPVTLTRRPVFFDVEVANGIGSAPCTSNIVGVP